VELDEWVLADDCVAVFDMRVEVLVELGEFECDVEGDGEALSL
jgi:hypothetical protein